MTLFQIRLLSEVLQVKIATYESGDGKTIQSTARYVTRIPLSSTSLNIASVSPLILLFNFCPAGFAKSKVLGLELSITGENK